MRELMYFLKKSDVRKCRKHLPGMERSLEKWQATLT